MTALFSPHCRPGRFPGVLALLAVLLITGAARAIDTLILDAGHGDHDRGATIG